MRRIALTVAVTAALVVALPAAAITNGQPDNGGHPHVGQLLFYVPDSTVDDRFDDPGVWFNCSATLLTDTILLTAGHCVFGVGDDGVETTSTGGEGGNDIWVNFADTPDYSMLNPSSTYAPDRNDERYDDWTAALETHPDWIRGTAYPHPDYNEAAFYLHDLGVVELDEEADSGGRYGELPELDYLETLAHPKGASRFTIVGYGLELIRPVFIAGGDTRNVAESMLVDYIGVFGLGPGIAAIFSSNNGKSHQGGMCYGDSGGPIFEKGTDIIVAVNSFGFTPYCTGNGGGYRVDQPDDLEWLASDFGLTPP
jgi:hypothetical protein